MVALKSDFLRTLEERGFVYQISDAAALDAKCLARPITAYIGFDCTADSLHVGSLVQIMLLRWLQKTGHKPIVLMGGGTTKVGDPSGKDESRQLLTEEQIDKNMAGIKSVFAKYLTFGGGKIRRGDGQQRRLARQARLHPVPARRRQALHDQPHADLRQREAAPRPRAAADVSRIQLHDPPGLRLSGARAPPQLHPADGRLGPVGQHHQRRRARPPHRRARAVRPHLAAADDGVGRQDGKIRLGLGLAQRGPAQRLRLLAVLAECRGRRRWAIPETLHRNAARRDRAAREARRRRDQRSQESARDRG